MNAPSNDLTASKSKFARICNVSAARVTQWIAEGIISADALVGEGRGARIRVELAKAQVRRRRDIGQALGNGLGTRLAPGTETPAASTEAPPDLASEPTATAEGDTLDEVQEQIAREKLEQLQRRNREEAEDEKARQGRYTETAAVRREMAKVADQMMRVFEGSLTELATAVHGRFQIEQREVLHLMREEFRKVRAKAAEQAAAALPALVEDASAEPAKA